MIPWHCRRGGRLALASRGAVEAGFDAYLVKPVDPIALPALMARPGRAAGSPRDAEGALM